MIKVSVHQEDITFINVYAPNNRTTKLSELKGVRQVNTPPAVNDRTSRYKINKPIKHQPQLTYIENSVQQQQTPHSF